MVFPLPGGHCMMILCPPAAAMMRALFACSCPWIVEKSIARVERGSDDISSFGLFTRGATPVSMSTTSWRLFTAMTSISGITDASGTFASGRNIYSYPSSRARIVAGRAHWIERTIPSSASSPRKSDFPTIASSKSYSFPSIPSAIGRS